jgi:N-acetylmuramoyl-L-alanine amidase
MTRFSLHGGHNSIVQGANYGNRKEHVMARQVKDAVAIKLRNIGHIVYDDTDELGVTQSINLNNIIKNCNSHDVDLVISFHLNAYNSTASGVEVCYYDKHNLAARISAQLSKDIGWRDRGAKQRKDLAVLKRTKAPAILLELGFIDNENDMMKWDIEKIANAITYTLTGQTHREDSPTLPSYERIGIVIICTDKLRVRTGPSTNYGIVKEVYQGERYQSWGYKDGWYNVGKDQWVSGEHVKFER